ncbi:MAG: translocase, partial [Comamonadaceae bacterium]
MIRAGGFPVPGPVWGPYPLRTGTAVPRRPAYRTGQLLRFARQWERCEGTSLDQPLRALSRACRALQSCGIEPRWQQVYAAGALVDQRLVEMATGEGKTYAIALAAATAALLGAPVHVVTANDYLAARDAERLRPFYAALGLQCGVVGEGLGPAGRRAAYAADVTYVTARELAFDYLRDNVGRPMSASALEQVAAGWEAGPEPVMRGLCVGLLDEADSILVDEARMPLVLAGPAGDGLAGDLLEG